MTKQDCTIQDKSKQVVKNNFYGVGFNSKHTYRTSVKNKTVPSYNTWQNMLQRCYCPKRQIQKPTYVGCTVSEQWHDFQDFAEWYENHPYSGLGYQLDKDLLTSNNKVYSPDNCCFIPQELNSLITDNGATRGKNPQGVSWHKHHGKYIVHVSMNGKHIYLGLFDCPNEAHQAYKEAKESNVKRMALEWQDRIADNVFQALMRWRLKS